MGLTFRFFARAIFWVVLPIFLLLSAYEISAAVQQQQTEETSQKQVDDILLQLEKNTTLSPDQKFRLSQEALHLSEKLNYQAGLAKSYYYYGNCLRVQNKNAESKAYLTRAINLSTRLGDSVTLAFANLRLSIVNRKLGKLEEAFQQAYAGLAIAEHFKDNQLLFPAYSQLASLFVTNNSFDKGLTYYKKAADVSRAENNDEWLAMTYNNIGVVYLQDNDYKTSIRYLERARDLNKKLGNKVFLLDSYVNLGATYGENNQRAKSLEAHKMALKLAEEIGGREEQQLIIMNDMAVDFDKYEEYDKAIGLFKQSLQLSRRMGSRTHSVQILKNLAAAYLKKEDFEQAAKYHIEYTGLKDSLAEESRAVQLAELESKYENEKKSKQIALLEKDNQIKQDRISRRTLERNAIIAVLFLAIVVSVLIVRIYRNRQRTAVLLAAKNEEISQQRLHEIEKEQQLKTMQILMDGLEQERKRIAADLHDRLGSMLSTVKLHFKAAEQPNQATITTQLNEAGQLLDESIQEVRRISHNMVSGVLMKFGLVAAIEDMQKNLTSTGQINCKLSVFGLQNRLPADLEVPLYRILQELVNNALKHASATEITIQLNKFDDLLNIVVEDNGTGFNPASVIANGMGLANIQARISQLGGTLNIDSGLGNGTTFIIDVPMQGDELAAKDLLTQAKQDAFG